jgi:hypothetical protein
MAAIVLTVRRFTRQVGQGMLIGLTLVLPITFYGTLGVLYQANLIFRGG